MGIGISLTKAKDVAHNARRIARSAEFAPLDDAIAKRIPDAGDPDELENARQKIRDKYARLQEQIDQAEDVATLYVVIESLVET